MHSENWKHCKNHCRAGCDRRLLSVLGLLKAAFHLVKILDFVIQAMGWGERALEPFKNGRDLLVLVFQKHPSALATSSF